MSTYFTKTSTTEHGFFNDSLVIPNVTYCDSLGPLSARLLDISLKWKSVTPLAKKLDTLNMTNNFFYPIFL